MNPDVSITSRLSPLFYLWGSALTVRPEELQKHQLTSTVLFSSSPNAWTLPADASLTAENVQPPATGQQQYPLALLVRGQFPDAYSGTERPAWPQPPAQPGMPPAPPPEDTPAAAPQPAPGKLLVVGDAQMLHRNFLAGGNLDFFLNSIDALALGDEIINVRGKKQLDRTMTRPGEAARQFWKFVNLGLVNLLIAAIGVGSAVLRRRARAAYTTALTS
jgi:hypothetical protein